MASRVRWWEDGKLSIEVEEVWFAEAGLDFRLDQKLFDDHEVVVFRGELRLGDDRASASVHYPPNYGVGGHPTVVAPDLRLGRHQDPMGALCLDHPVSGITTPMYGAEAVEVAERLWDLWRNNRDELYEKEADAPDPQANYYDYQQDSAVTLLDVDVSDFDAGYLRLGALQLAPFRAGVAQVRTSEPTESTLSTPAGISSFVGPYEINGRWFRVSEPPPVNPDELDSWVRQQRGQQIQEALIFTDAARKTYGRPDLPTVIGLVYPDEGPGRGETHDAWLFLVIRPDGKGQIARAFHLRSDERWLRQPQLEPLEKKKVAVIGIGALGSPMVDLLAKAGVGRLSLLDAEIYALGNRVRHQLDLTDLGHSKARAMANRVLRVNPWADVDVQQIRLGAAIYGEQEAQQQEIHDVVLENLSSCDLLINTTAHVVTGYYISRLAREIQKPVIHVWVSAGAWGGRILLQRPGKSGCPECLACYQEMETARDSVVIPQVADDPEVQEVQERGCADTTFTGPGFDLMATAAAAARISVQALLGDDGYPAVNFDLATLSFRDTSTATPSAAYTQLPVHPDCSVCHENGSTTALAPPSR